MPIKKRLTIAEKRGILRLNKRILKHHFKTHNEIIGLDLGTIKTGLYSNKKGYIVIEGGNHTIYPRISQIKSVLKVEMALKSRKKHKPFVLIEDYAYGKKMVQTAELGGLVRVLLFESGIPYLTIAPNTLKKFVVGKGEHQKLGKNKTPIMVEVLSRWGEKFSDDNACDAYCLVKFMEYLKAYINNKTVKEFEQNKKMSGILVHRTIRDWEEEMFDSFITTRGIPR